MLLLKDFKISWEACSRTPLGACAYGARRLAPSALNHTRHRPPPFKNPGCTTALHTIFLCKSYSAEVNLSFQLRSRTVLWKCQVPQTSSWNWAWTYFHFWSFCTTGTKPSIPNTDQSQSSPFKLWVAMGSMVWRNGWLICFWDQS